MKLEKFLQENKNIMKSDISSIEIFGYNDKKLFDIDLEFLMKIYNNTILTTTKTRLSQSDFRKALIEKFNGKCIVTGSTYLKSLQAAHIIPYSNKENPFINHIDNGLLLDASLHIAFDNYEWSINPETCCIEANIDSGFEQIKPFIGNKIDSLTYLSKYLLKQHYDIYVTVNT